MISLLLALFLSFSVSSTALASHTVENEDPSHPSYPQSPPSYTHMLSNCPHDETEVERTCIRTAPEVCTLLCRTNDGMLKRYPEREEVNGNPYMEK
jgi:hypothetical protein